LSWRNRSVPTVAGDKRRKWKHRAAAEYSGNKKPLEINGMLLDFSPFAEEQQGEGVRFVVRSPGGDGGVG